MTDRVIVFQGSIPQDTDLLNTQRNAMVSIGTLIDACIGATAVNGFALTPTSPATLTVNVGPGQIFSQQPLDTTAYGSLPADTADLVWKNGTNIGSTAFTFPAPSTSGQSINYLIQCAFVEADGNPLVLGYYNAANPTQPLNGPAGAGTAQNTMRTQRAYLSVKAGAAGSTGTQATPLPDTNNVGLYVVTVAYGQTQITSANLTNAQLASAPFLKYKLGNLAQYVQSNTLNYAIDSGTANAYVASISPSPAALVAGLYATVRISNQNTGASTLSLNGLGIKPITDYNGTPIVAGALVAGGIAEFVFDGNNWQLTNSKARVKLTSNLNLYVATTGSDTANTGLSSGSPFATIQHAVNFCYQNIDFNGNYPVINVANGTYTSPTYIGSVPLGMGANFLTITGASQSGTIINVANGTPFTANIGAYVTVQNMTLSGSGSGASQGYCLLAGAGAYLTFANITFGAATLGQIVATTGGSVFASGNYSITGSAPFHAGTANAGTVNISSASITLTGTPAFSGGFAYANLCGITSMLGNTYSGSATGPRYSAALNGVVNTNGGSASLPGSTAGATATGGQVN